MPRWIRQTILEFVLLLVCIALAFSARGFFTVANLMDVLRNVSMQGIIAFGMTMVIIAGEIDLSVGSMVAFSGCLAAWLIQAMSAQPSPPVVVLAILAAIVVSVGIGSFSGWLRVRFRVPTFISTLAWLTVLRGASGIITNGFPLMPFPDWYSYLAAGRPLGIPFPAIVFIAVFGIIQFVMGYTAFGRSVYAVGGNAEAARLSGINVSRIKIAVMAIVAALAALAGILQSSQVMSGSHRTATGWELDVIAAVIIGGTSLMGGAGRVWGTLIGVIFLGVLANGMNLLSFTEYQQLLIRGGLILTAVLVNQVSPGKK